ncbi:MAG: P1 family peptidase [Chloroflexi bacterium]|nr:P1 family peptidase [Chloroflexota bacterium]
MLSQGSNQERRRARGWGLSVGTLPPGPLNALTDVAGVRVGHCTLAYGDGPTAVRTGVTVVLPHGGDPFREKAIAAVATLNGFGKPLGFEQVRELGTLESPIGLTNTLCVGPVAEGLIRWELERNPKLGQAWGSINAVVGECNDGFLNDLRGRHVRAEHALEALEAAAGGPVAEGNVGAGAGMCALGYKGGVGTSSRQTPDDLGDYRVGALVVANFGAAGQLRIDGLPVGRLLQGATDDAGPRLPGGSVMVVLATDAPATSRQLGRLARRAGIGLARVGSLGEHGSGDFVIAFSTAQRFPHGGAPATFPMRFLNDAAPLMNALFQAVAEAVEEAVVNALLAAETCVGFQGHRREGLPGRQAAALWQRWRGPQL